MTPGQMDQKNQSAVSPQASDEIAQIDPRAVLSSIGEVIYDWRIDSDEIIWSGNAAKVLGLASVESIATGRKFAESIAHESGQSRFEAVTRSGLQDHGAGVAYQTQYALQLGTSEHMLWVEDTGRWFAGTDGSPAYAHGVMRVINERYEAEKKLMHLSRYDQLTGQLNRTQLTETLATHLEEARKKNDNFGFIIASIDNLAIINTSYGFDVADEVIRAVAQRLRARMRGRDVLGRYSGNKFGIILNRCEANDLAVASERFIRGVRDEVIMTSAGPVSAMLTIGALMAPRFGRTVAEVMQRTHETLDLAKQRRRGGFATYSPSRERETARHNLMKMTDEVLCALNDRRFVLAFQPIVNTQTRQRKSYECLARIRREDGSVISAGQVIPLLEKLGLVRLIDLRVLELAVEKLALFPDLHLSVNVSTETAADPDWREALMTYTQRYPNIGKRITLELTETALIANMDEAHDFIALAREQGCQIAIDDFGSGHTSFKNLKVLGVDYVKIDGVFIQNITRSSDDRFFVKTLVDLAKHLNAKTVAEWVQDEESARILHDLGVDYLQGTHVGDAALVLEEEKAPSIQTPNIRVIAKA